MSNIYIYIYMIKKTLTVGMEKTLNYPCRRICRIICVELNYLCRIELSVSNRIRHVELSVSKDLSPRPRHLLDNKCRHIYIYRERER